ncbi:Serine/threonine-protein phosphatase, partial [Caligus rogercresseyi]
MGGRKTFGTEMKYIIEIFIVCIPSFFHLIYFNNDMQALSRLTNDIPSLNFAKTKCKDSFSSVAFYSKVNLKKKLRSKSAKFSSLIDFDTDLGPKEEEPYEGPVLYDSHLHPDESHTRLNITEDNLPEYESFFFNEGLLQRKCVYALLAKMEDIYRRTPILVDINLAEDTILNVCGDIHGQYNDLLKILRIK